MEIYEKKESFYMKKIFKFLAVLALLPVVSCASIADNLSSEETSSTPVSSQASSEEKISSVTPSSESSKVSSVASSEIVSESSVSSVASSEASSISSEASSEESVSSVVSSETSSVSSAISSEESVSSVVSSESSVVSSDVSSVVSSSESSSVSSSENNTTIFKTREEIIALLGEKYHFSFRQEVQEKSATATETANGNIDVYNSLNNYFVIVDSDQGESKILGERISENCIYNYMSDEDTGNYTMCLADDSDYVYMTTNELFQFSGEVNYLSKSTGHQVLNRSCTKYTIEESALSPSSGVTGLIHADVYIDDTLGIMLKQVYTMNRDDIVESGTIEMTSLSIGDSSVGTVINAEKAKIKCNPFINPLFTLTGFNVTAYPDSSYFIMSQAEFELDGTASEMMVMLGCNVYDFDSFVALGNSIVSIFYNQGANKNMFGEDAQMSDLVFTTSGEDNESFMFMAFKAVDGVDYQVTVTGSKGPSGFAFSIMIASALLR